MTAPLPITDPTDEAWHRFALGAAAGMADLEPAGGHRDTTIRGITLAGVPRMVVAARVRMRGRVRRSAEGTGLVVRDHLAPSPGGGHDWCLVVAPEALDASPLRLGRLLARLPGVSRAACAVARRSLPSTGLVLEPRDATAADRHPLMVMRSADRRRAVVVRADARTGRPVDVVKVDLAQALPQPPDPGAARAAGRRAGVRVPRLLGPIRIASADGYACEWLPGRPVAVGIRRDDPTASPVLTALAAWLLAWAESSARRVPLTREWMEMRLLEPAEELRPLLAGGDEYLRWLERLCDDLTGTEIPTVEAHNDLTMHNVLDDGARNLAVVDWDGWGPGALPWEDLHYAAVDLVVAGGRATRAEALAWALLSPRPRRIVALEQAIAGRLAAPDGLRELSLHACWLGHARRARTDEAGPGPQPFLETLQRLVAWTQTAA